MARKEKNSFLEDVVEITARLPWWLGVLLAVAAYLLLHYLATREIAPPAQARSRSEVLLTAFWRGLALTGQYLVPLAFSIGAVVSAITRYQRRRGPTHRAGSKAK